jgi:membrane protease YdiL (CAAX protease family)
MSTPLVIAVTAISWAMLHYTYSWTVIAIIVVDGVLLGLVRWKSGSILPPILMHAVYNLYAIW